MAIISTDQGLLKGVEYLNHLNLVPKSLEEYTFIPKQSRDVMGIRIELAEHVIKIFYHTKVQFYRAICQDVPYLLTHNSAVFEEAPFAPHLQFLLDASRNGVPTVEAIKEMLGYFAAMGIDDLYLYIEDTYLLNNYPKFGYLRGAYSAEDISSIVQQAAVYGIEIIPAVQTLAHLTQALKWEDFQNIRDDDNTLLIDDDATYTIIDQMMAFVASNFPSKKVHIGMDESYQAGLGQYLLRHGYEDRFTLIQRHLNRVLKIVDKYNLQPMMWSDFLYHVMDKKSLPGLYRPDAQLDPKRMAGIPSNIYQVHWDYGSTDPEKYKKILTQHLKFTDMNHYVYAGAAHIYGRTAPNHGKTRATTAAGLMAAKAGGVQTVLLTTWGDDGQEINHWSAILDLFYFSQQVYGQLDEAENDEQFKRLFSSQIAQAFKLVRKFDELPGFQTNNPLMANPAKTLLWQDPLLGVFDGEVAAYQKQQDLVAYYHQLANQLMQLELIDSPLPLQIGAHYYQVLASVLALKVTLGVDLGSAYANQDNNRLLEIEQLRLPNLIHQVERLADVHQDWWLTTYRPEGFETLAIRYGGLIQRLHNTQRRLSSYQQGEIMILPELEIEKQRVYDGYPLEVCWSDYGRIANTGYHS